MDRGITLSFNLSFYDRTLREIHEFEKSEIDNSVIAYDKNTCLLSQLFILYIFLNPHTPLALKISRNRLYNTLLVIHNISIIYIYLRNNTRDI